MHLLQGIECLIELGDVRVVQFLHDLNLSLDPFPPIGLQQLELLVNLAGDLLISFLMQPDSHDGIGPFTNTLAY